MSAERISDRARPLRGAREVRRRVRLVGFVALGLGVLVVLISAFWVGGRAIAAKTALERAQSQLTTFKSTIGESGGPGTLQLYSSVVANTDLAAAQVDDPVWRLYEGVPAVGPNLKAFRRIAQVLDTVVRTGVRPVAKAGDGISIDSLKPVNGALDIAPLRRLGPAVAKLDTALRVADAAAGRIDTRGTLPQISSTVVRLRSTIGTLLPVTGELKKVAPLLYPALGGGERRHYVLMFQNNAEERAGGGNPAALAELKVSNGRIQLGRQPNSQEVPHPFSKPLVTYGGDWDKLYGPHTSTYLTNFSFTPDFPATARMVSAMWLQLYKQPIDGVISVDPVALSYLMRATGPIPIGRGVTLTSANAVQFLLSDVYKRFPDSHVQNALFSSAAKSIFKAVSTGQGSPRAYVQQLAPMLNQQRLKVWSARPAEEAALLDSPAGTMLPAGNRTKTTFGVYYNDDSTSKMSYYMDATVGVAAKVCRSSTPSYTVTTKVTDTLKASEAAGLPKYVLAGQPRIPVGGDRQWVQVFGPVGAKLGAVTIDGRTVRWGTNIDYRLNTDPQATGVDDLKPAVHGEIYGRPLAIVSIKMGPEQSRTVVAHFAGGTDLSTRLAVSHTPKVRAVPVTVTHTPCG